MGVAQQNKCTWQTGQLPFHDVIYVIEQLAASSPHRRDRPRTKGVIDANLLGFKYTLQKM
jgi:hypothetical protein